MVAGPEGIIETLTRRAESLQPYRGEVWAGTVVSAAARGAENLRDRALLERRQLLVRVSVLAAVAVAPYVMTASRGSS